MALRLFSFWILITLALSPAAIPVLGAEGKKQSSEARCRSVLEYASVYLSKVKSIGLPKITYSRADYYRDAYLRARAKEDSIGGVWAYLHLLRFQSQEKVSFRTKEATRGLAEGFKETPRDRVKSSGGIPVIRLIPRFFSGAWGVAKQTPSTVWGAMKTTAFVFGPHLWTGASHLFLKYPYQANAERVWDAALNVGANPAALDELGIPRDDFLLEVLQSIQEGTHDLPGTPRENLKAKKKAKRRALMKAIMPTMIASLLLAGNMHPVQWFLPNAAPDIQADDYLHLLNEHPRLDPTGKKVSVLVASDFLDRQLAEQPVRLLMNSGNEATQLKFIDGLEARAESVRTFTFSGAKEFSVALAQARNSESEIVYILTSDRPDLAPAISSDQWQSFPPETNFVYLTSGSGNLPTSETPGVNELIVRNHEALAGVDSRGSSVAPTGNVQVPFEASGISSSEFFGGQAFDFIKVVTGRSLAMGTGLTHYQALQRPRTPSLFFERNGVRMFDSFGREIHYLVFDEVFPDQLELKESLMLPVPLAP